MHSVRVKKDELLEKMKKNREGHRALFEKAVIGYRKALLERLEGMIADIKRGSRVEQTIRLPEPADHTKDYDCVISMLEMSTEDEIDLDSRSFSHYVMDDWAWKDEWVASNSVYAAS